MNKYALYERAYKKNGNKQKIVAMEEMSELIKELSKDIRGELNLENLYEEYADVTIMMEQLNMIYRLEEGKINKIIESKLERLQQNLAESKDQDALQDMIKALRECKNELCLKCGNYRNEHLGACDGCKYKDYEFES